MKGKVKAGESGAGMQRRRIRDATPTFAEQQKEETLLSDEREQWINYGSRMHIRLTDDTRNCKINHIPIHIDEP